jgi:hypothetical protein
MWLLCNTEKLSKLIVKQNDKISIDLFGPTLSLFMCFLN